MITSPPSLMIEKLLTELGLVSDVEGEDWQASIAFLPENRDKAVCIYDTSGVTDGRNMRTGSHAMHPGIQIQIAAVSYLAAWQKANLIAHTLDEQWNVEVTLVNAEAEQEFYTLQNINRQGDILHMGVEQDGSMRRHFFSINALLTILQAESTGFAVVGESGEGPIPFYAAGAEFFVQS